jgi:acylphosphatase
MRHAEIRIFGLVQGVGFRSFMEMVAEELGLAGFVKNRRDGSLYVKVEGDDHAVEKFVEQCRKGPIGAVVKNVAVRDGPVENYRGFIVRK